MPTFMAIVVATLVAWLAQRALPAPGGMLPVPGLRALIALVVWFAAFSLTRRLLLELRPIE